MMKLRYLYRISVRISVLHTNGNSSSSLL